MCGDNANFTKYFPFGFSFNPEASEVLVLTQFIQDVMSFSFHNRNGNLKLMKFGS
jgi:hypothetical protein